ncbi:signal recognition particle-docking protein FtsY [Candidatus Mycalebacterium sp.]
MTNILKKIIPVEEKTDAEKLSNAVGVLKKGLAKSRSGLLSKLKEIVAGGKVDEDLWESFEEMLILSDAGTKGAAKIRKRVEARLSGADLSDYEKIKNSLMDETARIFEKPARPAAGSKPRICMVVGVNGTGKTTTTGKLAGFFSSRGEKVMLAAADTFRAAATEQLEQWALRSGSEFIKGKPGADPSAVAFDAIKAAQAQNCDTVIIDTAGRLHTKTNLMDELSKIKRVVGKAREGAPDDVFLVLDATTGQNAIRQTEMFNSAVGVTGIVLTKIDGTAKGGVVIAVCEEFEIPVAYVGTGEGAADITEFDPVQFASVLFDENG